MEGHHELLCVLTIRSSSILTPKRKNKVYLLHVERIITDSLGKICLTISVIDKRWKGVCAIP